MEKWQTEINRLNKIRVDLDLNWNRLEKLTKINRAQLKKFFEFTNVPSMKFYFEVKSSLENEFMVKEIEKLETDGSLQKGNVPKMENKPAPPTEKASCDCKLENGLLKRGKIKCTKSKAEHNF